MLTLNEAAERLKDEPMPAKSHIDPRITAALALPAGAERDDALQVLIDEASAEAVRKTAEKERAHAAFHGRPLVYVTVERRRGYRGRSVCRDCYYGREWR